MNKNILFVLVFVLLLFSTVYSYSMSSWELDIRNAYILIGRTDVISVMPNYLALLIGIYLYSIENKTNWIKAHYSSIIIPCCIIAIFWFLESVFTSGPIHALYASNTPLVFLTFLFVVIGAKDQYWELLLKIAPYFAIVYVVLMLFNNYSFSLFANARLGGNNPITTYLVSSFWWVAVMLLRYRCSTFRFKLLFLVLLLSIAYIAFVCTYRSWMIQTILLFIATIYVGSLGNKTSRYVTPVLIMSILTFVLANFLSSDAGLESIERIIEKSENDTRSFQYEEIFSQVGFIDWILGGGLSATYKSQTQGGGRYSSIDNQYLMVLFHFGIFMFYFYFILNFKTIIRWIFNLKRISKLDYSPFIVLSLWMCALGGLSVYNALAFFPQMFIMPIVLGRCMNILHTKKIRI